jgi:hypothetical protein
VCCSFKYSTQAGYPTQIEDNNRTDAFNKNDVDANI